MGNLFTPSHILVLLILGLLLFGPKKLPELGHSFGKMLREFKAAAAGLYSDEKSNPHDKQLPSTKDTHLNKED